MSEYRKHTEGPDKRIAELEGALTAAEQFVCGLPDALRMSPLEVVRVRQVAAAFRAVLDGKGKHNRELDDNG